MNSCGQRKGNLANLVERAALQRRLDIVCDQQGNYLHVVFGSGDSNRYHGLVGIINEGRCGRWCGEVKSFVVGKITGKEGNRGVCIVGLIAKTRKESDLKTNDVGGEP